MRKFLTVALIATMASCTSTTDKSGDSVEKSFKSLRDAYVIQFLRLNPVVNTYLGGAGLDPSLREVDGLLRDHSNGALEQEDKWLESQQASFEGIDSNLLTPALRIDREVVLAQIRFLLRQHTVRRHQERAGHIYR
jgi:hypothetical protein